ncbi:MAG: thermonuclease family protein [Flavobacteriales bacterium]|jgi:endonuclease YncB( thermonuclease family)|uniref:thermonuclease family protein n=1 Tax=Blattabacterium sp. (Mastotermes darwiniensis) TaxID=39768 RepID=UPI000231DECB|nr:thermonuclease family protein [Blattabacterium sp. (Mastotermes darwiniensis)]AER40767.1 thermonuclease family protein [Blattabacterium sp. (Mastotermes darwiniensis) str. MADAR]MDR1804610.1 thermonuclease family protein [Flavobacteriales bacterium]
MGLLVHFFILLSIIISQITGKVIKIYDGDTFKIKGKMKEYKIRISDIDCPEKNQSYGVIAKNFLKKKILNKKVLIKNVKKDKYNRLVGLVIYDNNKDLGKEILESGLAWVWKFSKNIQYKKIEDIAKRNKIGLWKKKKPINPYDWKKIKKLFYS